MRNELALLIKHHSVTENIKLRDLCDEAGISRWALFRYLRGDSDISSSRAEALLKFFGIDIGKIIRDEIVSDKSPLKPQDLDMLRNIKKLRAVDRQTISLILDRVNKKSKATKRGNT